MGRQRRTSKSLFDFGSAARAMAARTLQEARNLARIRASGEEHALTAADVRLQDALADGTLRLLSCSWLRRQPEGFVIPRHQDLPKQCRVSDTDRHRPSMQSTSRNHLCERTNSIH